MSKIYLATKDDVDGLEAKKQNKITGTAGQIVMIGSNGTPAPENVLAASKVQFTDGKTFQQKLDDGSLKGPKGDTGAAGAAGAKGETGAKGADGVSPTVAVSKSGKTTTVTFTDAAGEKKATILDGTDGATGPTGPAGPTGAAGANGKDGVSPTVKTSKSGAVTTVTITDASGAHSFEINDGANGANGKDGAAGATGPAGPAGAKGDMGDTWVPSVDASTGNLSWTKNSGTEPQTVNIKGPQGATGPQGAAGSPGKDGAAGKDGVSPTVTTSKSGSVTTVTITDASGAHKFDIKDGANGANGKDGAAGATGPTGPAGPAPTVNAAAGTNINVPGTPSVTASQSGSTVTLTFNNLKGAPGAQGAVGPAGAAGAAGPAGAKGDTGDTWVPSVDASTGNLSWTKNGSGTPQTVNIKGPQGATGPAGAAGATGAKGADGVSPTVKVSKSGTVTTVTITDASGAHTATINDGANGANGKDGAAGAKGADGFSPTVATSKSGSVTTVTITDASGAHKFDIKDGTNGTNGSTGPTGPAGPNTVSTTTGTNITGLLKGNGSTVAQAVAGTDYATPAQVNAKANKPTIQTIKLTQSGWGSGTTQTVSCSGIVTDETKQIVDISPAVSNYKAYCDAGCYVSSIATNQLIFTCGTKPSADLTVYVSIQNVG